MRTLVAVHCRVCEAATDPCSTTRKQLVRAARRNQHSRGL